MVWCNGSVGLLNNQTREMTPSGLILAAVLAHLMAVISPGPDFVVALRNSLQYSRRTGIWTALGFALGIVVHVFYCIAGIALVISQSPTIFNFIKIGGGLYLLYIGFQSFRASEQQFSFEDKHLKVIPWHQGLKMGFITNILNPKATLFFLSIFTILLKPGTPFWVSMTSGVMMVVDTFLWFALVAYLFTQKKIRTVYIQRQGLIHKVLGGMLMGLGLLILV